MQSLEVSVAARPLYWSLGVKGLIRSISAKRKMRISEVLVYCNSMFKHFYDFDSDFEQF